MQLETNLMPIDKKLFSDYKAKFLKKTCLLAKRGVFYYRFERKRLLFLDYVKGTTFTLYKNLFFLAWYGYFELGKIELRKFNCILLFV